MINDAIKNNKWVYNIIYSACLIIAEWSLLSLALSYFLRLDTAGKEAAGVLLHFIDLTNQVLDNIGTQELLENQGFW